MTECELIEYMRNEGRKSISLVQMHLKMSYKAAKKFCENLELIPTDKKLLTREGLKLCQDNAKSE